MKRYFVLGLDDDGTIVMLTRRIFNSFDAASDYLATIAASRAPFIVATL